MRLRRYASLMGAVIIPEAQRRRQAVSSLQGYAYQLYASLLAWAELDNDGKLLLEIAEDYAKLVGSQFTLAQVKAMGRKVTLRDKGAVQAIQSLWQFINANKNLDVQLTYLTTAEAGLEKGFKAPGGFRGIDYWGEAARGADIGPLRALLEELELPDDLRQFILDEDDETLREKLLRRLTWACGSNSLRAMRAEVAAALGARATERGLLRDDGRMALPTLLEALLQSIIEGSRELTHAQFDEALEQAATMRVSKSLARSRMAAQALPAEDPTLGADGAGVESPPFGDGILRVAAYPFLHKEPRPVNLLMTLGVSRSSAVVVTTGLDSAGLLERLNTVEWIIEDAPWGGFAPRAWSADERPAWRSRPGAQGLIWKLGPKPPSHLDLAAALAGGFGDDAAPCGNVLILALPVGAEAAAVELAARIEQIGRSARKDETAGGIPIYLWSSTPPAAADRLLARLMNCIETGGSRDRNSDVDSAYNLRLSNEETPLHLWRTATRKALRLHDMSVFAGGGADNPHALDERRGRALIKESDETKELLYALPFLPVSIEIVAALSRAPDFTRAVAGLLTPDEARSRCPPWSVHRVEGFRPNRAGSYFARREGGSPC